MNGDAHDSYGTLRRLLLTPEQVAGVSGADWVGVLAAAEHHRVTGLLAARLELLGPSARPPDPIAARLRGIAMAVAVRNSRLLHELSLVLRELRAAGRDAIVLKGAHLIEEVYDSPAMRSMDDADILVRSSDLVAVEGILRRLEYIPRPTDARSSAPHHLTPFEKPGQAVVEVHWTIPPSGLFRIDAAGLFTRAVDAEVGGVRALVLCPEDLLLHLCIHASVHHRFGLGLRALFDVSETVKRYGGTLKWEALAERSREWGASRALHLTLLTARDLAGAAVPDRVLADLRPADFDPGLAAWAAEQTARRNDELWQEGSVSPRVASVLGARSMRERAIGLLRLAFPSKETLARLYNRDPRGLAVYWCYVRRLADLVARRGPSLARLAGGDAGLAASTRFKAQLVDTLADGDQVRTSARS